MFSKYNTHFCNLVFEILQLFAYRVGASEAAAEAQTIRVGWILAVL